MVNSSSDQVRAAYLQKFPEAGGPAERVPIWKLPFTLGRSEGADHTVYSGKVSKEHARLDVIDGRYVIRDLDSTNGTFVNGHKISTHTLEDGDVVHLAQIEFRFRYVPPAQNAESETERLTEITQLMVSDQRHGIVRGTELLRELIEKGAVDILFQPIVDLRSRSPIAYEALARGTHPDLSTNPATLLALADRCGLVVELSRMLAKRAVMSSTRLPYGTHVFVNVHAAELAQPDLLDSLSELARLMSPGHQVVLEIAEASVTDVSAMGRNKEAFNRLGLQFAYDDFGAGQARLIELTDIPPDYLKFDKVMIEGIEAAAPRQEMVGALLRVVRRLGVRVIAEGVETEVVAGICQRLGCDLGQGYLFGRPA
jgi:EAL domain-containing protein (putative c-di-GMP-specific phosphodiesterase class I)